MPALAVMDTPLLRKITLAADISNSFDVEAEVGFITMDATRKVRRHCRPIFHVFHPHFLFYEVVSVIR